MFLITEEVFFGGQAPNAVINIGRNEDGKRVGQLTHPIIASLDHPLFAARKEGFCLSLHPLCEAERVAHVVPRGELTNEAMIAYISPSKLKQLRQRAS